jgi:hypothetical protein
MRITERRLRSVIRKIIRENEESTELSKEDVLRLAHISQLNNGKMGLHTTFAIGEGGKPFWSNKLTCAELMGAPVSGLKGRLVKSSYVGIDLDNTSIATLKEEYGKKIYVPKGCLQDESDTGLAYSLPHHVTFGMGNIDKLSLKNQEGKKVKHNLTSFKGEEFSLKAEGLCCEEVNGVMICAVKIGFDG